MAEAVKNNNALYATKADNIPLDHSISPTMITTFVGSKAEVIMSMLGQNRLSPR
jgi:hypothetical protein